MEQKLLVARVDDLIRLCDRTGAPKFSDFLSEKQAQIVKQHLASLKKTAVFFGGYEGAQRTQVGFLPEGCSSECFPIVPVSLSFRKQDALSHRDFLGAITGLGLDRSKIGDILVEPGRAVAFLEPSAAKFVLSQICKIGKVGVKVQKGFEEPLPGVNSKKELSDTVASLRLDCVVASVCGVSRKEAAGYIGKDLVAVNSSVVDKATHKIGAGDILSVRKKGRFVIKSIDGVSKKGRTVLIYDKYI